VSESTPPPADASATGGRSHGADGEYVAGARPTFGRFAVAVIAVVAAAALVWVLWAAWSFANRTTGHVVSYQLADRSVTITIEVVRKPGTAAECLIRSRNQAGAEVGRKVVTIPAGPDRSVVVTETFPTSDRPISGELRQCRSAPGR
jgi:hypothetical protein